MLSSPLARRVAPATIDLDEHYPCATDGEIAAINLESARLAGWARFARDPHSPGVADSVVHTERMALQFLGDPRALDRLDALAAQLASVDDSFCAVLVQAQVASLAHRFKEARRALEQVHAIAAAIPV